MTLALRVISTTWMYLTTNSVSNSMLRRRIGASSTSTSWWQHSRVGEFSMRLTIRDPPRANSSTATSWHCSQSDPAWRSVHWQRFPVARALVLNPKERSRKIASLTFILTSAAHRKSPKIDLMDLTPLSAGSASMHWFCWASWNAREPTLRRRKSSTELSVLRWATAS